MADTLSRKHRLKQHEQQQQLQRQQFAANQQVPYGENFTSVERPGGSLMKNGRMTAAAGGGAENDNDYGAECFKVFEVVEVGTNTCHGREEFCSTRTKLNNNHNHNLNKERLRSSGGGGGRSKSSKSRITAAASNLKGENVNVVRDSGQIERRNESHFDHFGCNSSSSSERIPKDDYNHNHHHHHWREHPIYDDGSSGSSNSNKSLSRARKTNQNHRNHATATATNNSNYQLSKTNLSSLNGGSSTTKSIGGSSSSGFSSSNGSGSSYTCSSPSLQQQLQQHSSKKQQADCAAQTGGSSSNNNNDNKQRGQFYGHDRGMAGKRSKLIDDLDRLLMPPAIVGSNEASSLQAANNNDRCRPIDISRADELRRRRSSLVSPTESHISTATNSSQHPSIFGTARKPNFDANDTANDFDYSTLCRDEFSSFIQIDPFVTSVAAAAAASKLSVAPEVFNPSDSGCGPMLVGVHEAEPLSNNVCPHAIRDSDDDVDDGAVHDNVVENVSDAGGLESDELEPYEEFKPVHYDGNVYEEIPDSMPSSMEDQMSSLPIISTSPSYSESAGCDNNDDDELSSPIVCQNYSPETMNGDDYYDDYYCKSFESTDNNAAVSSYSNLKLEDNCEDLSRMLDVYIEKVNSLIRLTKNDKSISIHEVFKTIDSSGHYRDDYCFEVRADHRTPVAFVAHSGGRENSMSIIQEIEYENEDDDQRIGAHDRHRTVVTHVSDYNNSLMDQRICQNHRPLKSILESIQISPELCWSRQKKQQQQENDACDIHSNDLNSQNSQTTDDIRFLEESLITRLSGGCDNDRRQVPVAIIREHLREFIENYHTYQRELNRETSFAHGSWHENWLFASKRPRRSYQSGESSISQEVFSTKRARLSNSHHRPEQQQGEEDAANGNEKGQSACQMENEQADLIKYSTLILAKCKPVKLTLSDSSGNNSGCRVSSDEGHHYYRKHADFEQQQPDLKGRSDTTCHIERLYEAQLERFSELELVAIESSRQTDVCQLLLHDTDDDDDDCADGDTKDSNNNKSGNRKKRRRPAESGKSLLVSYGSTSLTPTLHHASKFYFTAAGYLFQTSLIRFPIGSSGLRAKLESKILNKLILCVGEQSQSVVNRTRLQLVSGSGRRTLESERTRFVISLSNLELINRLPVIQFCAKISGLLPIRVRWFRQSPPVAEGDQERYEELSDISANCKRKNLNIKSVADKHSHWPIELQSSYDYEYQTPSASWLRFRRNKDDILFEIREPNFDTDYNRLYKCLIENPCSRRECKFQLTTKGVVNSSRSNHGRAVKKSTPLVKSREAIAARASGEEEKDGHALLRTWSQRTLNKPQPTEPKVPTDTDRLHHQQTTYDYEAGFLVGTSGRQQTVGRLSASSVDGDKFGKNFPYHPENLLKRLEENKFSIPAKRKLVTTASTQALSATMNDCHLTQNESMFQESSAVVAESMWSNSKILIDADVAAKPCYPKQPQSAREQLALADNNSGLNATHADPEQPSDSHRLLVNNSNKENNFGYSQDGHDASEQLGLRERPRAVINPRPFSSSGGGSGSKVDDSTGRLKATQQLVERNDNDSLQQVPIQQPKPRRRLNQPVNSQNKELDQKENYRPSEHNRTNQGPDSGALPSPLAANQSNESGKHSNQVSAATASDVNSPNDSPPTAPAGNRQKLSGSNVKSLISRFSMA